MTDELDGDVITEFVSAGAKNYGYKTREGKVVCTVRGFTLNVRGLAVLNFHTMKDILAEFDNPQDHRHTLLFPKGFGTKVDQSHSTRKALWTSFRQMCDQYKH